MDSSMADSAEKPGRRLHLGGWKFIVAIVLILGYSGGAAYGLMSDMSIRGLTVKMFNVSRYCTTPSDSLKILNYNLRGSIWSTSSLQTSLSHLSFTLSVDGSVIGTATQSDASFGPGQSATYNVTFTHPTLNPTISPLSSKLVLTLSATVAAGLYSQAESASDNSVLNFGSGNC
jgi:hypothetical protein